MNSVIGKLDAFGEWTMRLAYISALWLAFTIIGLGIFGIMPATSALCAIMRKWLKGEDPNKIYKIYWLYYKDDFLKTNIAGFIFLCVGIMLVINLRILLLDPTMISRVILALTIVIALLYLAIFVNFFPVYVHYDLTVMKYFKQALLIAVLQPIRTFIMLIWTMLIIIAALLIPNMSPLFTMGFIGIGTSWIAYPGFLKLHSKHNIGME